MPGPDTVAAGPPGWVVAAFRYAVSRPDTSATENAQIRLANQAGYTRAAGYTPSQQVAVGQGLYSADAFAAGQGGGPGNADRGPVLSQTTRTMPVIVPSFPSFPPVVVEPQPIPRPQPSNSSGSGGSGGPSTGGPWRPGAPGSPDVPIPVPVVGVSWPWIAASVLGPYVVPILTSGSKEAWDWIKAGRPIPKGPKTRRARSPHHGPGPKPNPQQGDPFPAKGPETPKPAAVYVPRADRVAATLGQLGGDIWVNSRRLPVPKVPRPAPAAPPLPAPKPLWQTLLPIVGPALLSYLMPAAGNRTVLRLTDPLSQPFGQPLTALQTSVASYGAFGGSPGQVGSKTCECKAPAKKRRKKKRTVCYSGTYIERADGTRKSKKRKVPCI